MWVAGAVRWQTANVISSWSPESHYLSSVPIWCSGKWKIIEIVTDMKWNVVMGYRNTYHLKVTQTILT